MRAVPIGVGALWLLVACNGSDSTGPSNQTTISDLQARTLQRPLDDRPVLLEIVVTVSNPQRVVGGEARLRRLRAAEDTCQAPGLSPVVATAPIVPSSLEGNRLRVVLRPRLPAGRSRLCFFIALPGLAEQVHGSETAAAASVSQTNELDLVLDVVSAGSTGGPSSPPGPPPPGPPPPRPVVTIGAPDPDAAESPLDTGTFRVSRTGSTTAPLTVFFSVGGTATSGPDYNAIGTSVVIPAGSATADITVTPINDTEGEEPETVVVTLSANAAYSVGSPNSATVTITSDDVLVKITGTTPTSGPEGDTLCSLPSTGTACSASICSSSPGFDGTVFQITVGRVGSTAAAANVTLALTGTAGPAPTTPIDYAQRPFLNLGGNLRQLTIPAGSSEERFCLITTANTSQDETVDETAIVTIQSCTATGTCTVGSPNSTTVTIQHDD